MFCKNCGAPLDDGATFCERCGKEVSKAPAAEEPKADGSAKKPEINGFYKSKDGKLITGVCAGLAKKFNMTPWVVRIIFIVAGFIPILGWALLAFYIVGAIVWKFDDELISGGK